MYTEVDIQRIRDARKEKEYLEMLKAARDKIKKGIEQNDNRSGERAIWELIQNARDLSEHASIRIHLRRGSLEFSHQGEAFNLDTLSNLIKQQSTKHEGEDTVGQYGTGFMTTHAFCRKVFISGDCRIDDENGGGAYISLPEGFCLDRTSDEEWPFIEEMKRELAIVDELIGKINEGHPHPCPWTTFTYPLEQDGKAEKVSAQLEITLKLMPYVLVFNDRIERCAIVNGLTGESVTFYKLRKEEETLPYDASVKTVVNFLVRENDGVVSPIEIHTLESADGDDRIVIPPLPRGFDDVASIPSQFIFFPLLGTEGFGTNFIFHSRRLYPTERRNSFLLPKDNDGLIAKFRHNEKVLDEMMDVLFAYYDNNVGMQSIPIEFAEIAFRPEKQEDPVTKAYLQKLQDGFVNKFIHWKMIPTDKGFLSIEDDGEFAVLNNDIYSGLTDDSIEKYIPAFVSYASNSLTLPSEKVVEWSRIVFGWKPDEEDYYVTLESVCESIREKGENLKSFLSLLKELGQTGTDLLSKYALIPNRDGTLRKSGDLRDAQDITKELFAISKPLLGEKAKKLVDPDYAGITTLAKYDRTSLKDELQIEVGELRKKTIKRTRSTYYSSTPDYVSLDDAGLDVKVSDIVKFCSAYPKEGSDTFRSRILPIICRIYGLDYAPFVIPPVSDGEADFYSSAFTYLLDNTLFVLSHKHSYWLKDEGEGTDNLPLLKEFLAEYTDTTDTDRLRKLDEYGVFPNRKLAMCLPKDLKKSEADPIPERILDLYRDLAAIVDASIKDYKDILVHEDFESLYKFSVCKASEMTDEMESMLREKDKDFSWENTRKIVLDIIEGIDNGEWPDKDIFREIREKKPTIFFKNAVSGEKGKHVYTLMRQSESVIEDLAALAEDPEFADIISKARDLLDEKKLQEADFQFKKELGNHIEKILREKLSASLNEDSDDFEFRVDDVQNGQDIIVSYKDSPIYFIEVKTKWNFTTSGPAYMSKNQVLKACSHADEGDYALCCVDLTDYDLPDRTYPDSVECIHDRIRFQFEIGKTLGLLMKPTLEADKTPEDLISIDGDYKARIPAKVFRSGKDIDELIARIMARVR